MSLTLYQASIPHFVRMLGNLSAILDKAAAHAEAKKIDPYKLPLVPPGPPADSVAQTSANN